jgi:hypothetical protein
MPALSTYADTSITARQISRLAAAGAKVIQPGYDGVVGDGVTDDRIAMQAVITARSGERIVIAEGNYLVGKTPSGGDGGLVPLSGTDIFLHPQAVIKAKVMSWVNGRGIFDLVQVNDVNITGGTLDGQRSLNPTGYMNGIYVFESNNIRIDSMKILNVPGENTAGAGGGDGVAIRGQTNPGSTYVCVTRCAIDNCVRQGLGIYRGQNIYFGYNKITNIAGTDPGGGIDHEPDVAGTTTCEQVIIDSNFVQGCNYGIICNSGGKATIINNEVYDCRVQALRISDADFVDVIGGRYFIGSSHEDPSEGANWICRSRWVNVYGAAFLSDFAYGNPAVGIDTCQDLNIQGCRIFNSGGNAIRVRVGGAHGAADARGFKLLDNVFYNNSEAGTVIALVNDVEGWTFKDGIIKGNQMYQTTRTPTNGIGLTLMSGADLLTWDIGPNYFAGGAFAPVNNYAGFPTGYGPGNQVPTADLPAASAKMDGQELIEYIDATHRAKVWYRNGKRFKGASVAES